MGGAGTLIDLLGNEVVDYTLSEDGRVFSHKRQRYLSQWLNSSGYLTTKIGCRTSSIHRLLALNFIPNPDNLETVNHRDLNKLNNSLDNLEWLSREDNVKHALKKSYHLRSPQGDIVLITGLAEFCRQMGLTQANMSKVILGQRPHHKNWRLP